MENNPLRKHRRKLILFFLLAIQIFSLVMLVGFSIGEIKIHSRIPYLLLFSFGIVLFLIIEGNKNKIVRFSYLTIMVMTTILLSCNVFTFTGFYQPEVLHDFSITELYNSNPVGEEITLPLLDYLKENHPGQKYIISEDLVELFPEKEFLMWAEANQVTYKEIYNLTEKQVEELDAIRYFDVGPVLQKHFYIGIDNEVNSISDIIYIIGYNDSIYVLPSDFFEQVGNQSI